MKIKTGKRGSPRNIFNERKPHDDEAACLVDEEASNPSIQEALTGPYADEWRRAMKEEFNALSEIGTWTLTERPENRKVIGSRWVLRTKYDADGNIERRKARLVAKGYNQQPGMDFTETFAPVARQSSIRTLLAISAELGLKLYQLDVVLAYINGDLEEEIYMEQAEGFEVPGSEDLVYSLKRSIYGLKQSGRQWFKKLDQKLKILGLEQLSGDKCVYIRKNKESTLIVAVYVDDRIVTTDQIEAFEKLKDDLSREFKMKDLGRLHHCLGIEFEQDVNTNAVFMFQRKYIGDVLRKFGMQDSKPVSTPLDGNIKLSREMGPKTSEEMEEMSRVTYQSLIGSLMYLAVSTRPDIAYAVSSLSQFNQNPGKAHWISAKRILRYLKGTQHFGLLFTKNGKNLHGYVDADWGAAVDDRRSYTGFVFKLANSAISWESRKQRTVALSSTEAEYMALTEAAKETTYLRCFLKEVGILSSDAKPTNAFCDNQEAQELMRNPVHHARSKHINIRHHYVREVFEKGDLEVEYIPTTEMVADVLTKALFGPSHRRFLKELGIVNPKG